MAEQVDSRLIMQGNDKIAEHGEKTRFKPGKSGNPKGRKPSILKKLVMSFTRENAFQNTSQTPIY